MSTPYASSAQEAERNRALRKYYRRHARIYDATRWSFLFGRRAIVAHIAKHMTPNRVLEVGCGTGTNLQLLAKRFPHAALIGVDVSEDMLRAAARRLAGFGEQVRLQCKPYPVASRPAEPFDLILFSYSLSMFNPGWEAAIAAAARDLGDGGVLAVVDFHDSPAGFFKRWMGVNHVRMDGHLRPELGRHLTPLLSKQRFAYGGLWRYLMFLGTPHRQ